MLYNKCDAIKQNESEVENFLLGYHLNFNFVKTPWRLDNWFSRNSILSDCKNNKKQKKLSALFGYILKLIFASSNSFCLIASQIAFSIFLSVLWNQKNRHTSFCYILYFNASSAFLIDWWPVAQRQFFWMGKLPVWRSN